MTGEPITTLVGGVTAEPTDRSSGDRTWVTFDIAVTPRRYEKDSQQWVDGTTTYMPCSANGRVAQQVLAGVHKGSQVVVVVELETRNWEKEGQKRSTLSGRVLALGVTPRLDNPSQTTQTQPPREQSQQSAPSEPWSQQGSYSDETPF